MNRREFVGGAAVAWTAVSASRIMGANERIGLALVGCGGEGPGVASLALRGDKDTTMVAVCDVFESAARKAREMLKNGRYEKDFRRVLEDKDVDAVIVATPDHWHCTVSAMACQAGKDVYVEKPLGQNIREGRKVVTAARRYNRIVQLGTQGRSTAHIDEAQRIVQSGELGKVHLVRVFDCTNEFPQGGAPPVSDPPAGLDWDFWLGPAPKSPFTNDRFRDWRGYFDYGSGVIGDMGTHQIDSVHRVMGADSPLSITALGNRYELKEGADTPDVLKIIYEYPGFVMDFEASRINGFGMGSRSDGMEYHYPKGKYDRPHGAAYFGTNGTLFVDPAGWEIFPEPKGQAEAYRMERRTAKAVPNAKGIHVRNFLACVRSRKAPNAEIEIGHRSSIIPHLGNIAYKTKEKLYWDREKEEFKNSREASRLLGREARKPYNLI